MKIAMLARNAELYTHKRLKEAAEKRGHELHIIDTLRCYMNIASRRPSIYYNGERLIGYDAVIPRIGASITFYGLALALLMIPKSWPSVNQAKTAVSMRIVTGRGRQPHGQHSYIFSRPGLTSPAP
jgi:glutathione synthase/RimK-type ligase-like ATP-grasp enzyme